MLVLNTKMFIILLCSHCKVAQFSSILTYSDVPELQEKKTKKLQNILRNTHFSKLVMDFQNECMVPLLTAYVDQTTVKKKNFNGIILYHL